MLYACYSLCKLRRGAFLDFYVRTHALIFPCNNYTHTHALSYTSPLLSNKRYLFLCFFCTQLFISTNASSCIHIVSRVEARQPLEDTRCTACRIILQTNLSVAPSRLQLDSYKYLSSSQFCQNSYRKQKFDARVENATVNSI